jgi:hypothetical protein
MQRPTLVRAVLALALTGAAVVPALITESTFPALVHAGQAAGNSITWPLGPASSKAQVANIKWTPGKL